MKKSNWKPKNNRVIVELEGLYNKEMKIGGQVFKIDHAFRRMWHAVQHATVIARADGLPIEPGDKVYVHHFVVEDERRVPVVGKEYRWLEYNQIYCKVKDGIIKALGNFILVEPIKFDESKFKKQSKSGLILTQKAGTQYVDRIGVVAHIGDEAKSKGVNVGDKVFFNKNCEYEINIEGKIMYRMEFRDVITVVDPEVEFTV